MAHTITISGRSASTLGWADSTVNAPYWVDDTTPDGGDRRAEWEAIRTGAECRKVGRRGYTMTLAFANAADRNGALVSMADWLGLLLDNQADLRGSGCRDEQREISGDLAALRKDMKRSGNEATCPQCDAPSSLAGFRPAPQLCGPCKAAAREGQA